MDEPTLVRFRKVIGIPNGIILVTGPTGSGKTTTLYSALNELNKIEDKLITTEDPVEYDWTASCRSRSIRTSASPLPLVCVRSCGMIPTGSWSARSAIWRRPRSPSRRR
jgi:energy-coupling factor transporter ATP-binding protein EcfA2